MHLKWKYCVCSIVSSVTLHVKQMCSSFCFLFQRLLHLHWERRGSLWWAEVRVAAGPAGTRWCQCWQCNAVIRFYVNKLTCFGHRCGCTVASTGPWIDTAGQKSSRQQKLVCRNAKPRPGSVETVIRIGHISLISPCHWHVGPSCEIVLGLKSQVCLTETNQTRDRWLKCIWFVFNIIYLLFST